MNVFREFGGGDELSDIFGGVGAIAADFTADDAFKAQSGEHGANDPHIAAMLTGERAIINADDIGQGAGRLLVSHLLFGVGAEFQSQIQGLAIHFEKVGRDAAFDHLHH